MKPLTGAWTEVDADLLIVPVFEGELATLDEFSAASGGEVARAIASREFTGKTAEVFLSVLSGVGPRRLAATGLGRRTGDVSTLLRRAATTAALQARQKRISRIVFDARALADDPAWVQAATEGLVFALFDTGRYKTVDYESFTPADMAMLLTEGAHGATQEAVRRGEIAARYCNIARELANEPGNALSPPAFADRLADMGRSARLRVDVLDAEALRRLGMGLLVGVGQGSAHEPRLVVFTYEPEGSQPAPVLGMVGKGITFDTGGISIKPAADMERMKGDMAGAAAVASAMCALAELEAPVRTVGVMPIAENMPGGRAIRPGDVIRSAAGRTVEIVNTDAEGRLILADGLWYAQQLGATHLVDVATLTGAVSVALGRITSGLFGTPPSFVEAVRAIADRAGDRVWPMPLFDDYKDLLRSDIADTVNTGGRYGGAITAAMFLKEFTGGRPWAHLDIAGTTWSEEPKPYMPKGPTGAGVRTLIELGRSAEAWRDAAG